VSTVEITPARSLAGTAIVPGDKSISHRALLLSALAPGTSSIIGLSAGDDVVRTRTVIGQLGAAVEDHGGVVLVTGGRDRLGATADALDFGNSGTGMRLAMGVLASIAGEHHLEGDASLSARPMDRVAAPLRSMGAIVAGSGPRCTAPLVEIGGALAGITYEVPVPSAQVKSAVLLAGLAAEGPTVVREQTRTRPHTEEMIEQAGGRIEVTDDASGRSIRLLPSELRPMEWAVAADPSQSAFFIVGGLLASAGEVSVGHLYPDATRIGFLGVLERMGAEIDRLAQDGTLKVTARSSHLTGTVIDAHEIPSLDEVPILAVAAAAASGTTRFVGVEELRIKESDRFARTIELVGQLGAGVRADGDDIVIEGLGSADGFAVPDFDAGEDHRMAMSTAIAGTVGRGALIRGFETVASSFPGFLEVLGGLRG